MSDIRDYHRVMRELQDVIEVIEARYGDNAQTKALKAAGSFAEKLLQSLQNTVDENMLLRGALVGFAPRKDITLRDAQTMPAIELIAALRTEN